MLDELTNEVGVAEQHRLEKPEQPSLPDRVVELRDGKFTEFLGGYTDYLEQTAG